MKRNTIERGKPISITKADLSVANIARKARRRILVDPARLNWFVKNLKHTFARGPPGLHKLIELMQPARRIVQECRQHEEGDQVAKLQGAGEHGVTPEREYNYRTARFEYRHRRAVQRPYPHHHEGGVTQLVAYPIKARMFLPFAHETFDLTNAGKVIVQQRVHGRSGAPLQSITSMRRESVGERAGDEERKRKERKQRELYVQIKHHRHHNHDLQNRDDTLLDPVDQNALD